ncbi:MAG: deoxyguanosinetriphosphate triphosphohydrolase [Nitrospinota bacterium]|nr:deoxyguanosinetriphosphate triphosphohydrolase [Nitrospinota bacterium]MDH5678327.1 deoxyguanosinetriphosphate triphosphohydrolase [Nitrospinota bacterium]MDH5756017.1 deoxyguanosinetriphosphate triphosphohydrolase [Nitrospinota bacterium]
MLTRAEAEARESQLLAPYACLSAKSRGRANKEEEHEYRTAYVRDRDRIIHSSAFRRLEYKTQVFVYHEGDYYRTRLTHTLEVAQIARIIARALNINEDLCEAIALSHDIGHPPFGHSGEEAMNKMMKEHGGFEHNVHALRIIDHIEHRYHGFRGINLTWEVREAVAKHSKMADHPTLADFRGCPHPSVEAQVTDAADSIAYVSHDLDDGLKSGLINTSMLEEVEIWRDSRKLAEASGALPPDMARYQIIRNIIGAQVGDLVRQTEQNIQRLSITTPDDARNAGEQTADFSKGMARQRDELRQFLRSRMYKHNKVIRMEEKAYRVVEELFRAYEKRPELLPEHVFRNAKQVGQYQLICDYVAGMTDRYALQDHSNLFDPMVKG